MLTQQRIALVDDDKNILTSVAMALEAEGFAVSVYSDGAKALAELLKNPPALVLLDVKMPRMNGIEVLKKIRERSAMPVAFLTSCDEEIDEMTGLRLGADDYITKPFSHKVLLERIRAILRRHEARPAAPARLPQDLLVRGSLQLDEVRYLCSWKKRPIDVTVTEFLMLRALVDRPGHVKSREQLMDAAYSETLDVKKRTIDSHVRRIRKKFKDADPSFDAIETVYGIGYLYKDV